MISLFGGVVACTMLRFCGFIESEHVFFVPGSFVGILAPFLVFLAEFEIFWYVGLYIFKCCGRNDVYRLATMSFA